MFNMGFPELVLTLIIALVIFGPAKLPEIGKALGKGISEFKSAVNSARVKEEDAESKKDSVNSQ